MGAKVDDELKDKRHLYKSARVKDTIYGFVKLLKWDPVEDEYLCESDYFIMVNGQAWVPADGLEQFVL